MINFCNNIIHLFKYEKIYIHDRMIPEDGLPWEKIEQHIHKKTPFNKNMNYYEYKRISVQYHKTVTCNISVSESSQCTMEVDKDVLDVPVEIGKSYQEHHLKMQLGTQMWINSIQLQYHVIYLKLNTSVKNYTDNILAYINIYQYMSEIYMIQKIMQSIIHHTILQKCFNEFTMNIYQYKLYIIRFIILTNSNCHRNNTWDDMQQCNNSRSYIR